MADDRGDRGPHQRPHRGDRPQFPPRPFRPPPPRGEPQAPLHTLRLRDGEREIEVSGSAPFVRQVLDDLPSLVAKLRGEAPSRPASIRMPAAPERPALEATVDGSNHAPAPTSADGNIEDRVLAVLRDSRRPLAVAAIRKRLGGDVTPQQVRRVLERAGDRVTVSGERPATYRIASR